MPDVDLSFRQRCALLLLMAEAREVPNAYLTNVRRFELKANDRNALEKAGLVEVKRAGQRISLQLTDKGWHRAKEELRAPVPDKIPHGSGYTAATLYAMLETIARHFDRAELSADQFFVAPADPAAPVTVPTRDGEEIEARIRKAYAEVAPRAGAWVMLAKVRGALGPLARRDVDAALVRLSQTPGVRLIPETNQKSLSAEERAAAVRIGNEDKHLIAFDS